MHTFQPSVFGAFVAAAVAAVRFLVRLPARIIRWLATERRNAMYLRELDRMDAPLLKDVGYRRDEVMLAIREGRAAFPMGDEERMTDALKQPAAFVRK